MSAIKNHPCFRNNTYIDNIFNKKIIYIDLDNTIFKYSEQYKLYKKTYPDIEFPQSLPEFFIHLKPYPEAVDVIKAIDESDRYEVLFLTAPSIHNPFSYSGKRISIEENFGFEYVSKLIICRYKNLMKGHYLIDDNEFSNGQNLFEGELLLFGKPPFQDWKNISDYFLT